MTAMHTDAHTSTRCANESLFFERRAVIEVREAGEGEGGGGMPLEAKNDAIPTLPSASVGTMACV